MVGHKEGKSSSFDGDSLLRCIKKLLAFKEKGKIIYIFFYRNYSFWDFKYDLSPSVSLQII